MAENLSTAWLDEDETEEVEETVFGSGDNSPYMQGYSVQDAKVVMAYQVMSGSSDAEAIKLSFVNKDNKTHTETIWVKGKNGKPFTMKDGKKVATFGVNKIKSLLKVAGLYEGEKNLMKALYETIEEAEVTETVFGKEVKEDRMVLNGLIGAKVKLCISSKKVNSTMSKEQDDSSDKKYVEQCIKDAKKYCIANPKKKSVKKALDKEKDYVSVYRWNIETSVQHFCTTDGLFAGEIGGKGKKLAEFIKANEEGFISDARSLISDEMTDSELAKLSINKYGKRVEAEEDSYDEPTEETTDDEESEDEDW